MREKPRYVLYGLAALVALLALVFVLELFGLEMLRFFGVKKADVRREIWEESKSRTMGVIQDLAKHKHEWEKSEPDERTAIEALVRSQYANFDAEKIDAVGLKQWFIQVRGF